MPSYVHVLGHVFLSIGVVGQHGALGDHATHGTAGDAAHGTATGRTAGDHGKAAASGSTDGVVAGRTGAEMAHDTTVEAGNAAMAGWP
jgi:hypothetical protein